MFCGSSVDIPFYQCISQELGVNKDLLDQDIMMYTTKGYAVHRFLTLSESYTGSVIRIYTEDVHTGYVRLIREKYNTELRRSDLRIVTDDDTIHGPAVLLSSIKYMLGKKYSLSNAIDDMIRTQSSMNLLFDTVFAVHSPYWPVEATE